MITNRDKDVAKIAAQLAGQLAPVIEDATRSCLTCCHFSESDEICLLAKQRPPARVIAYGCEQYEDDIPF